MCSRSDRVFEEAEGDGDQGWCPDDPDYRWRMFESARLDAEVDRIREERHFGH